MKPRLVAVLAALALVATTTSGCLAQPAPEPAPAFSSEQEAFAAAEATYRAYIDALNQVDLSDPVTFEGVYAWTTGEARAGEMKSLTRMHADEWSVSGETQIASVDHVSFEAPGDPRVTLGVCTDVSTIEVLDESGASQVSSDRPAAQSSTVTLIAAATSPTGFVISQIEGSTAPC